jgi:diguanylate cyclase (GGDEF)-like protein/PAS domain S-box-containing protein
MGRQVAPAAADRARERPVDSALPAAILDCPDAIVTEAPNGPMTSDAIFTLTHEGVIETWSSTAERLFGHTAEEAVGQPGDMLSSPEHTARLLDRALAGRTTRVEGKALRRDGSTFELAATLSPIRKGDVISGVACIVHDITQRKQVERELQRLAEAAERGSDAIISIDLEACVRHWNRGAERLYGFGAEEAIGRTVSELNGATDEPEEAGARARDAIARMLSGEDPYQVEAQRRRRDGTNIDVLITMTPWHVDGRVVGVTTITTDISDRKRIERAREHAVADLEEAQRLSRLGSWTWDPSAGVVTWSAQMYAIFGRNPKQGPAIRDALLAYVHPEDREFIATGYAQAFGGSTFEFDYRIIAGDGVERTLHTLGHEDPERPGCYVGTFQDVTEQRRTERERARVLEDLHASEELFSRGFEGSPIGMALITPDGKLQHVNATYARMLGYDHPDQLTGLGWQAVSHPDDVPRRGAALKALLEGDRQYLGESRYLAKDGSAVHAIVATTLIRDAQARPSVLYTQAVDISDRVQVSQALAESEANYRRILETTLEGVWTLDSSHAITFVNPAMAEMLGGEPQEMIGRPVFDFIDLTLDDKAPDQIAFHRELFSGQHEVVLRGVGGRKIWALLSANALYDRENYAGALAMVTDITERKEMELRLQHLADHDPLTGIHNRRRLIEELDRQLRYAARSRRSGAVLAFDLDHLKVANDIYGHATGDAILRAVTEVLRSRTRDTDVVARLGGDEFAVILPEATESDALTVTRDVRALLGELQIGPPIMTSVGIVLFTGDEELTADEILVCADTALYEAKERGGDQATVYTGQTSCALTWVQRLHTALTENRFVLYGQPILDLRTGQVVRHELLIRMLSEHGEIVPPAQFIPTAERFGLIHEIDRWVTTAGLRLARDGTAVAINLSGPSIGEQLIIAAVRAAIADGLNPANVTFEITETAALSNVTAARVFTDTLTGLGCSVALDDFGTGFGSFTYLKHIPAQYLKIDTEFIQGLANNKTDQQVVKAIVDIAHSLDKLTIAEGVEDAETLTRLKDYAVDQAQGFHVGRPTPLLRTDRLAGV